MGDPLARVPPYVQIDIDGYEMKVGLVKAREKLGGTYATVAQEIFKRALKIKVQNLESAKPKYECKSIRQIQNLIMDVEHELDHKSKDDKDEYAQLRDKLRDITMYLGDYRNEDGL